MRLHRLIAITLKELHQMKRDWKMYPLLFFAPVLQLAILGYAASFEVKHVPTGVLDQDKTYLSRRYVEQFGHSEYFDLLYYPASRKELCDLLDRGKIKIGIDIPVDFQKHLKTGSLSQVQLFVDGTESNSATIAMTYATIISQRFSAKISLQSIDTSLFTKNDFLGTWRRDTGKATIINEEMRIWYNPELLSKYFFVPGVICMILLIVTTNLTAQSLVREREVGTLEQLLVSPATRAELILGKLSPFIFIGLADVAIILTGAELIFHVPIKGSIPLLFLFSAVFLFTTLGLGLFISTASRTQEQAMVLTFFFITTIVLLGGVIFPIENMPRPVQMVTYLFPLRYFTVIVRALFLKGVGMDVLWDEGLCLLAIGLGTLVLSILRFKKQIA
ncbi:MAG: ABC transporter permease [Deltaproteobacteria bacterium]|nr:ABC transporter permease [Deltaproteobacteria bacterium]